MSVGYRTRECNHNPPMLYVVRCTLHVVLTTLPTPELFQTNNLGKGEVNEITLPGV